MSIHMLNHSAIKLLMSEFRAKDVSGYTASENAMPKSNTDQ